MKYHNCNAKQANKSNKNTIITILACLAFIFGIFSYTIIYKIDHVVAMDSHKYHEAVDKYLNTETYH
jgi:hypothetical protein